MESQLRPVLSARDLEGVASVTKDYQLPHYPGTVNQSLMHSDWEQLPPNSQHCLCVCCYRFNVNCNVPLDTSTGYFLRSSGITDTRHSKLQSLVLQQCDHHYSP
jgi:hypothetical protein